MNNFSFFTALLLRFANVYMYAKQFLPFTFFLYVYSNLYVWNYRIL